MENEIRGPNLVSNEFVSGLEGGGNNDELYGGPLVAEPLPVVRHLIMWGLQTSGLQ